MRDFNQPGKASVLFDGQFGSTGKGLAAAYVALNSPVDISVTNASSNAGHTTVLQGGRKFITFHLPTAGVINENALIYLDQGAMIDPEVLMEEIEEFGIDPERLFIHPNAAVITPADKEYERKLTSGATSIASTQKGCGRALARKIMREGAVAGNYPWHLKVQKSVRSINLNQALKDGARVMIEVPQGFSLGIDRQFYPHTTSRCVSVMQGLTDAGVNPHFLGNVLMTTRANPIRVGNILSEGDTGTRMGYSGDVYPDQRELTWGELGRVPERTTVTKRIRRIFTWSNNQYCEALEVNRPTHVFLNFINYMNSRDELDGLVQKMNDIENHLGLRVGRLYGTGPAVQDVHNNYDSASGFFNERVPV